MKLELRSRGVHLTEGLRSFAENRLRFALGRFGSRVRRVRLVLTDVNGPRGGEDVDCKVEAVLEPGGSLVLRDLDADPFNAVARVSDRLGVRLARHLERRRERRRRA